MNSTRLRFFFHSHEVQHHLVFGLNFNFDYANIMHELKMAKKTNMTKHYDINGFSMKKIPIMTKANSEAFENQ